MVANKKKNLATTPSPAVLRLDALLAAAREQRRAGPSLESAVATLGSRVRDALFEAGVCERRAMLTGASSDAAAYERALVEVDAAHAELWAHEAFGHRLRVLDVDDRRADLAASVEAGLAESRRQMEAGRLEAAALDAALVPAREAARELRSDWPLPEAAIEATAAEKEADRAPPESVEKAKKAKLRRRLAKVGGAHACIGELR
jgi:hypothetical protein